MYLTLKSSSGSRTPESFEDFQSLFDCGTPGKYALESPIFLPVIYRWHMFWNRMCNGGAIPTAPKVA